MGVFHCWLAGRTDGGGLANESCWGWSGFQN